MRQPLGQHRGLQRQRRRPHQIERAILLVGLEQPVEPDQHRKQRAKPQDRRPDPRQQVEVRPERERHEHDDRQKEHEGELTPAAGTGGQGEVAPEDGEEGAAHDPILTSRAWSSPSGPCVAARIAPPAPR